MMNSLLVALAIVEVAVALPINQRHEHVYSGPYSMETNSTYPLFKQCDPQWANITMGTEGQGERASICREGCAMSCVAMALNSKNVKIDGEVATPATLNKWLINNNGYQCLGGDCNNLVLDAPPRLVAQDKMHYLGEKQKPDQLALAKMIESTDYFLIAHVRNNHHFVLLTGVVSDTVFSINDPGFDSTSVNYDEISDIITYSFN